MFDAKSTDTADIATVIEPPARPDVQTLLRSADIDALSPADRMVRLRSVTDGRIVFTHGFGIEGQLLLHWIAERDIDVDVVTLDTGRLFPETYTLWAETERRYGRRIRAVYPNQVTLAALVAKQGIDGFYDSKQARLACCDVRKTRPLDQALAGASAWITALRGDQTETRRDAGLISFDAARGMIKFNPLFDWTRAQVLAAVRANKIPINSLHEKGFASIGCAPCTRAIKPGEPERNGRWWWEKNGVSECGLHLPKVAAKTARKARPAAEPPAMSAGCG
jgi:phosphoadenosine phosphosulfate reductase